MANQIFDNANQIVIIFQIMNEIFLFFSSTEFTIQHRGNVMSEGVGVGGGGGRLKFLFVDPPLCTCTCANNVKSQDMF